MSGGGGRAGGFEAYLRARYAASVWPGYLRYAEAYRAVARDVTTVTYADVVAYVEVLRGRGMHAKTLRHHVSGVKAYHAYLREAGVRADHPCERLAVRDAVDRAIPLDRLYTGQQLTTWLDDETGVAERHRLRRRVAAALLVRQAATAGEVAGVRVGDVDLSAGAVRLPGAGKVAARTLPLRGSQALALREYVEEVRGGYVGGDDPGTLVLGAEGGPVAPARINALVNAGRPKASKLLPLRIRQTVIAGLLEAGHDVRVVQAFAGHGSVHTTEQYRRTRLGELAAAIAEAHPRR